MKITIQHKNGAGTDLTADDFAYIEVDGKTVWNVEQHRQPKICPFCGGAKVDKDISGIANSEPCAVCKGTGKLQAGA